MSGVGEDNVVAVWEILETQGSAVGEDVTIEGAEVLIILSTGSQGLRLRGITPWWLMGDTKFLSGPTLS